jgi:hypothetical protein
VGQLDAAVDELEELDEGPGAVPDAAAGAFVVSDVVDCAPEESPEDELADDPVVDGEDGTVDFDLDLESLR